MAVSTAQKVDYLLKKIGYTASKTGLAPDSVLSGTKKQPFAEAVPSPLIIASSCLWADSAYIPSTPPGSDSDYVKVYLSAASGHRMTADSSVAGSRAFIAYSTYNDNSTSVLVLHAMTTSYEDIDEPNTLSPVTYHIQIGSYGD